MADNDKTPAPKNADGETVDPQAQGRAQAPKDTAGVTGGQYADADANPAFHGAQDSELAADDPNAAPDLPERFAYEPDSTPVGGHVQ